MFLRRGTESTHRLRTSNSESLLAALGMSHEAL